MRLWCWRVKNYQLFNKSAHFVCKVAVSSEMVDGDINKIKDGGRSSIILLIMKFYWVCKCKMRTVQIRPLVPLWRWGISAQCHSHPFSLEVLLSSLSFFLLLDKQHYGEKTEIKISLAKMANKLADAINQNCFHQLLLLDFYVIK